MIRYECESCGEKLEVATTASGKPAECHKCHNIQNVPLPNFLPRVACPNCEHELTHLTEDDAGTIVKCPKCNCAVRAPDAPGGGPGCKFTAVFCLLVVCGMTWFAVGLLR